MAVPKIAPKVMAVPTGEERTMRPAADDRHAWKALGWIGLVFALIGAVDMILVWYPLAFGNPEWEFGTITSMLDGLPVLTLGLGLVLASAAAQGSRLFMRVTAAVFLVLALLLIGAGVVYATDVPLALGAVDDPVVALGLKKAITKTVAQAVAYPTAFLLLGISAWRSAARRR